MNKKVEIDIEEPKSISVIIKDPDYDNNSIDNTCNIKS